MLPLAQGVDDVQHGLFLPFQGEMSQAKETEREGPLTPQLHHKSPKLRGQEPASFIIFGFTWKTANRTRVWERTLEPSTINLWHTPIQPFPGNSCDELWPHKVHHSRQKTTHCNVNSAPWLSYTSSSRYKEIIGLKWEHRIKEGTWKKTRVVICVLKTPGKHKEVGGEKKILWARVSPPLSSCPSAKPNYSTTTGILYLWFSGLNKKAVASAGTLKIQHILQERKQVQRGQGHTA